MHRRERFDQHQIFKDKQISIADQQRVRLGQGGS